MDRTEQIQLLGDMLRMNIAWMQRRYGMSKADVLGVLHREASYLYTTMDPAEKSALGPLRGPQSVGIFAEAQKVMDQAARDATNRPSLTDTIGEVKMDIAVTQEEADAFVSEYLKGVARGVKVTFKFSNIRTNEGPIKQTYNGYGTKELDPVMVQRPVVPYPSMSKEDMDDMRAIQNSPEMRKFAESLLDPEDLMGGIRPHMKMTPAEAENARRMAEQVPINMDQDIFKEDT